MKTAVVFNPSGEARMAIARDWQTSLDLLLKNRSQKALYFFVTWFFDYIHPTFLHKFDDHEVKGILDGTGMSLASVKENKSIVFTRDLLNIFANLPEDVFTACRNENFYFDLFLKVHENGIWKAIEALIGPCQIAIGDDEPPFLDKCLMVEKRDGHYIVTRDDLDKAGREKMDEYLEPYKDCVGAFNAEYRRMYGDGSQSH